MNAWDSVRNILSKVAPILGGVIGGPGGAGLGALLGKFIGVDDAENPDKVYEALANNPELLLKAKMFQQREETKIYGMAVDQEAKKLAAQVEQSRLYNNLLQIDAQSKDKFQSRWRPTFAYCMCFCFTLAFIVILFILTYAVLNLYIEVLRLMPPIISQLSTWFILGGGVIGLYSFQRSKDKRLLSGIPQPQTLVGRILDKFKVDK